MKKVYLILILSITVFSLSAQPDIYPARAPKIRAEVWAWDNPAFKNYTVPDELKNESAVILARHRQIDATANKTNVARQLWLGDNTGKLFYTNIDRSMILINDQTALTHYSEFSFKEKNRFGASYSYSSNSSITILGARIIKPDGSVKEIDVSKSAVAITEGRGDKEAYKKLAIPELQINDILDFFVCDIYELQTMNISEQFIAFYSMDYPALHSSCSLTFGKNLTIEYRSINGAPQFSKTTDSSGNIVLTAESDNIKRINDYSNTRWISPLRDFPMIRFVVLQNASTVFYKPKSARQIGVHENVPYKTILEDAKNYLTFFRSKQLLIKDIPEKVRGMVFNYGNAHLDIPKEKLANIIYAALNFEWPNVENAYYNSATFILTLDNLMKVFRINSQIGFVTNKYAARQDEVLAFDDFEYMIVANNATQYFFPPYRYRVPGEIPARLQGESAETFIFQNRSNDYTTTSSGSFLSGSTIILPESSPEENMSTMQLQVSFNLDDMQKIDIKRNSVWLGDVKNYVQPWLLLYEDWDNELRRFLKIDKSIVEELNKKRSTRKLIPQVKSNFERDREKYSETIENEIKQYHGFAPEIVKEYSFSSLGVTLEKPQLEYEISYTMSDFVRNAGENIILDAGKLIGQQWDPTENDRNRNIDAHLPTRRIFENEIVIQIPDNYIVGNIEHLNVIFSNNYAIFEAVSVIENNTVKIKTKKAYHQTFIQKEDWNKLIDIIDKTNKFYSSSIVFQKISE
ncbi:MAG: DUF3857 domain-containing protein [Bacteroidetes bacterium]|nr:DUF3857 domain-containing protein [Bacteroidota bacterium]MCL2301989.1 DUF3857 domain-containing protein [Lentimicrobiaceae bacterium]